MRSCNWFGRFYHKVNDVPEIWKMESNHKISVVHSVGCFVKIDQETVIVTLETDWPQEATLSVVINSCIGNWTLNVGQIVPL